MTAVPHLGHAVGSSGSAAPHYRVDIRVGTHQLVADEPASAGGGDLGPSPSGLLLGALAACTAMTLRMYVLRKGWDLGSVGVDVRDRVDDDGRRVIERTITVPVDLSAQQIDSLVAIADRTPVTLAIRDGTPINTTFQPDAAS